MTASGEASSLPAEPAGGQPDRLPSGFAVAIPFAEDLGLRLEACRDGMSVVTLEPQPRHMNSWQVVHGGVVMTMLDIAMATAGRSARPELGPGGNVTIEMKSSFLRPATGRLVATGTCVHASSTLAFCEAELRGGEGDVVARASGTFKFFRRRGA